MKFERKGLSSATAQEYHLRYASEIAFRIQRGRHLSVLLPSMLPAYPLMFNIYETLDFREREYVVVESQDEVEFINELLINTGWGNDCIYPITYEQVASKEPIPGCMLLLDVDQKKRISLGKSLSLNKEQKIISIGHLEGNLTNQNSNSLLEHQSQLILDELFQMTLGDNLPQALVFYVDSILDVRDIMFARPSEKPYIIKQISDVVSQYERDCKKAEGTTHSTYSVNILREQYSAIDELSTQLDMMKTMVLSAGIRPEDLEEGLRNVKELKRQYSPLLENEKDIEKKELIISEFEGKITDLSVSLTQRVLTEQNQNSYETIIIDLLSASVWEKLSDISKKYLISARMAYDALAQLNEEDNDYSGVCLQITKTLDVELASRFYKGYIKHLEKKYPIQTSFNRWPNALKDRNGFAPLEEKDFTLGTIRYVIGVKEDGEVANNYSFREVVSYAQEHIYKAGISKIEIEKKLKNIVKYTEKVRREYRNPSAHRSAINYVTATDCMSYLIEHYKKLKEILIDMKI